MREMIKRDLILKEAKENYGKVLAYTKVCITKNHHDAEDIVSEAYVRFIDSYDRGTNKYQPNTNIVGYLILIVKRLAIDKSRKVNRTPKIRSLFTENQEGKEIINFNEYKEKAFKKIEIEQKLDSNKILQIMTKILSPIDREIMYLIIFQEYKYHEVAKKLKMKQGTIGSRFSRNCKKIMEEWDRKSV